MGSKARELASEGLSQTERLDHGLQLADQMVEAYLSKLDEPLDIGAEMDIDPALRRRRFEALREAEG